MDHRINTTEVVKERSRQIHDRSRSRWPDDGLPARHRTGRPQGSLHPAAVLADLFSR